MEGKHKTAMITVKFYEDVEDRLLKFAVILTESEGRWVFCKHRERNTFEMPGGHREEGETITDAAKRELYEETGAVRYDIWPVCVYSVSQTEEDDKDRNGGESFGMLYYARVSTFEKELHSEIEKIVITDVFPEHWTYPEIQPYLMEEAKKRGFWINHV